MSNISVRKIRNVPFRERKELIKCFTGSDFESESLALVREYPNEEFTDLLLVAAENKDPKSLFIIAANKNSDIVAAVELYFTYCSLSFADFRCLIETLTKYHYKNPSLPEAVSITEDYIIAYHQRIMKGSSRFPGGYGASYEIMFMLEHNTPHHHEKKLVDALLSTLTPMVVEQLRRFMTRLPQQDPLHQHIENALTVFDIIV